MGEVGLKIEIKDVEGRSDSKIIIIDGPLDSDTVTQAEKFIAPLIDREKHLIADCTNLSYVNSAGLAFFLKCYIQMKRRNGDFKIANTNKLIYDLLDICGVSNFLEVYSSLQEAIRSLEQK